jgi:hypothetical protein
MALERMPNGIAPVRRFRTSELARESRIRVSIIRRTPKLAGVVGNVCGWPSSISCLCTTNAEGLILIYREKLLIAEHVGCITSGGNIMGTVSCGALYGCGAIDNRTISIKFESKDGNCKRA